MNKFMRAKKRVTWNCSNPKINMKIAIKALC